MDLFNSAKAKVVLVKNHTLTQTVLDVLEGVILILTAIQAAKVTLLFALHLFGAQIPSWGAQLAGTSYLLVLGDFALRGAVLYGLVRLESDPNQRRELHATATPIMALASLGLIVNLLPFEWRSLGTIVLIGAFGGITHVSLHGTLMNWKQTISAVEALFNKANDKLAKTAPAPAKKQTTS